MVAIGMVGIYFWAINTFPIVTNDSLEYLDHSRQPGTYGMVFIGYRQIGYPAILLVGRILAGLVGVEPLLFSVLLQRLLLLGALAYAIWLWRWRAAPLVVLVITPTFLVYPNFVLTEGMTVPLSILLACLVSHHFRLAESTKPDHSPEDHRIALALAILACTVVFILISIRFPLAVFGMVPVAMLGSAWFRNRQSRKSYGTVLLVFVLAGGTFGGLLSLENEREFGIFAPAHTICLLSIGVHGMSPSDCTRKTGLNLLSRSFGIPAGPIHGLAWFRAQIRTTKLRQPPMLQISTRCSSWLASTTTANVSSRFWAPCGVAEPMT
jgi:hypothetical protein